MSVIIGQVATRDGASVHTEIIATRFGGYEERTVYTSPAGNYRTRQPAHIPVDINHDGREVGQVHYLAQRPLG